MRSNHSRAAIGSVAAAALLLAGCSGSGGGAGEYDPEEAIELEISWWGDDDRARLFAEVIDLFEEEHPNITVVETPVGAPDDLFNRLATDFAGGGDTAPDVFALGGAKPQEYADLGALLDLSTVEDVLDYSDYPDFSLTNAIVDDKLYGLPTGGNATAAFINADIFEQAGVPLPEEGWNWNDLVDAAGQIGGAGLTNAAGNPIYGIDLRIQDILGTYAAQVSEVGMYDWDGTLGVDADQIAGWYELEAQLVANGGLPDPSVVTSNWALPPDQQPFTIGQAAITFGYTNLMSAYSAAGDVRMMLPPTDTELSGVALLPSAFWSINVASEHPQAAAMLVDWFLHEPRAAELILDTRGVPFNPDTLDVVAPLLEGPAQTAADYVGRIFDEGVVAPPQPAGGSVMNELSQRMETEVLFGRMSPDEAAAQWVDELSAALE
ncbi:extracellular solute-binding protein [Glycomyces sp. TRM65418]|uniref:ABC transporter substrate-binding protein n=1 Tax=Glycomyces sp. TRM65418 TaxID=2867006 RepID=UPI001CE61547|nr:extracellular solute-binding protein [Glycomyces sp. TRM65418]MCC3763304.1 extracellular solute-binding protein [Glycomyces sp. TRM65418]QZD57303.1 extracellular solute-binding protein [Glycomyces sp. TRM65418]